MSAGEIAIGLLWHSAGAGNLGVGALTVGNMISARGVAEAMGLRPRFTVIQPVSDISGGANIGGEDVEVFDITGRSMVSPSGYMSLVRSLDCILDIGAGDSFAEIYGAKRFAYMMWTKEAAYLAGTPLVLSPQTIGPFTRQPYKALAGHAMARAFAVVARDPASYSAIHEIAPRARAVQSVDVAFRLPFDPPPSRPPGALEIGVNVSGLLFNGGYGGRNDYGLDVDYAELMRRFIAEMATRTGVRVHLICHVNSERLAVDDDGQVADRLAAEFPSVVRAPNFRSPSEAKSYIAGLDFLVAGRMHACIAAYSASVPVAPIAYSRKFSGLFEGVLGYRHGVPVRGMSTTEALGYLLRCVEERDTLRASIKEGQKVVAQGLRAYDDVLRELFARVVTR